MGWVARPYINVLVKGNWDYLNPFFVVFLGPARVFFVCSVRCGFFRSLILSVAVGHNWHNDCWSRCILWQTFGWTFFFGVKLAW